MDDNEVCAYGWSPKGERLYAEKYAERNKRLSIVGALNQNKITASFIFEGYCNTQVIETYIEQVLVPTLIPGQIVIMDNASFHKSKKIRSLIEGAGCELLYLPTYSPDLNPIENAWSPIKNNIRRLLPQHENNICEVACLTLQQYGNA